MKYGWSLKRDAWEELAQITGDLDWKDVPLNSVHRIVVPAKSGVYMICAHPPVVQLFPHNSFTNVIYAGRSETSIRSRFVAHCDAPDEGFRLAKTCYGFNLNTFTFFFATLPKNLVIPVETRLIDCYGPAANRRAGDTIIKGVFAQPTSAG